MSPASRPDLTALRAAWDPPFLAHPDDAAATAARGELTRSLAAAILSADLYDAGLADRTRVGSLYLAGAGWSRERAAAADAACEPGSQQWRDALGVHEHATLTGDGRGAVTSRWCQCASGGLQDGETIPAGEWVRYERWSARGQEAHGFVHAECRRLLQVGWLRAAGRNPRQGVRA